MFTDFIKSLYWEFLSYFVPERQDYKIVGECKKCGKCCRNVYSAYLYSEKEFEFRFCVQIHRRRRTLHGL